MQKLHALKRRFALEDLFSLLFNVRFVPYDVVVLINMCIPVPFDGLHMHSIHAWIDSKPILLYRHFQGIAKDLQLMQLLCAVDRSQIMGCHVDLNTFALQKCFNFLGCLRYIFMINDLPVCSLESISLVALFIKFCTCLLRQPRNLLRSLHLVAIVECIRKHAQSDSV